MLTEADLRAALRIVNEARDLPRGSRGQLDHVLRGLAAATSAQPGFCGEIDAVAVPASGSRCIVAGHRDGPRFRGFSLQRLPEQQAFGERERALVAAVWGECSFLAVPAPLASLSPRLGQVLSLLARGESEKQVAARLDLSLHTVHDYVKALHRRLGVQCRAELVAAALRA